MIPVIDIFAGPGGLGEGFSSLKDRTGRSAFKIRLSLEKEEHAHRTLQLRAFFRQFDLGRVPEDYYRALRGELAIDDLYQNHPEKAEAARGEAVCLTLGEKTWKQTESLIRQALRGQDRWVLIGGPPCQAYSLAGRARNKGIEGYDPAGDHRHFLYREYLKILGTFHPSVFVMENVKGLLSSRPEGSLIFDQIQRDLADPAEALGNRHSNNGSRRYMYRLFSLSAENIRGPQRFVLRSELYGVPQSRHRVIIIGVRDDITGLAPAQLHPVPPVSVKKVIGDLPPLRSGLSRSEDTPQAWLGVVQDSQHQSWFRSTLKKETEIGDALRSALSALRKPRKDRGGEFIPWDIDIEEKREWFFDRRLKGVCNHTARGHIEQDLYRYFFAACFAEAQGISPTLRDFPVQLLPDHENVSKSVEEGSLFQDRFRVQVAGRPATTITSHISKDGHYYIHYDPTQCRSLTVREAARLQTFPDNYFFTGPRTAQYQQVGNAVPPLMASQIAASVLELLERR
ncbi:MAG TPA: DNA cytosine methyltransferase [Acidobacteriaceae bacterium]|nr:DNA cytosine methyltransferase [Acidobacteriaceae bacterium]